MMTREALLPDALVQADDAGEPQLVRKHSGEFGGLRLRLLESPALSDRLDPTVLLDLAVEPLAFQMRTGRLTVAKSCQLYGMRHRRFSAHSRAFSLRSRIASLQWLLG